MDLSYIIVNYRSSRDLVACLHSILASDFKGSFEILVVDNSEGDSGIAIVEKMFPQIQLTINPVNAGFAGANNQAARQAQGRHLFFINPDVELSPDTTRLLSEYLDAHPGTGAVGPKVLDPDGTLQYSCRRFPTLWSGLFNRYSLLTRLFPDNRFTREYLMTDWDHSSVRTVDWISGCCFMTPRDAFIESDMFDEQYFLFIEDVDLCRTLSGRGHDVVYNPETTILHRISSSNQRIPFKCVVKQHQGMSYYHRKYMEGNLLSRTILDGLIAVRCGLQLALNVFR